MTIPTLKPKVTKQLDTRRGSSAAVPRIRGYELTRIRGRVALRDGFICQICGVPTEQGVVDHKQPLHLGGAEGDENRQWL